MADELNILVAGRHPEIVPTVVRLLRNHQGWRAEGTLSNKEAITYINQHSINILLLSSGLTAEDERELNEHCKQVSPGAIIIQHYGGGSGLLVAEINEAIAGTRI